MSEGKHWEDRVGWASCFPPRNPKSQHPPDFVGVVRLEDGRKCWIHVYKKLDRNRNRYVSVRVVPFDQDSGSGQ
jgi:uncharacterized OB-fold protein